MTDKIIAIALSADQVRLLEAMRVEGGHKSRAELARRIILDVLEDDAAAHSPVACVQPMNETQHDPIRR